MNHEPNPLLIAERDQYDEYIKEIRLIRRQGKLDIIRTQVEWYFLIATLSLGLGVGAVSVGITKFESVHGHVAFVIGAVLLLVNVVWVLMYNKLTAEDNAQFLMTFGLEDELLFSRARNSATRAVANPAQLSSYQENRRQLIEAQERGNQGRKNGDVPALNYGADITLALFLFPTLLLASETVQKIGLANYIWAWIVLSVAFIMILARSVQRSKQSNRKLALLNRQLATEHEDMLKWASGPPSQGSQT